MEWSGLELRGLVVDSATQEGVPGLRVIAVDGQHDAPGMLLSAETDDDGGFTFSVDSADAASLFRLRTPSDGWPDARSLHISVFNGTVTLGTFDEAVTLADFARGQLPNTLQVTIGGTAATSFEVSGRVLDRDGTGQGAVVVTAYRVEPDATTSLGTATTTSDGSFTIYYSGHDASTPDSPKLDLRLIATDGGEVGRSPIIFAPPARLRTDIVAGSTYRGRSEFDRIEAAIAPHIGATAVESLTTDAIELLARRANVYPPHLAMFVQAARLASGQTVTHQTFYALLRARFSANMAELLSSGRASMRAALRAAYDGRRIPDPTTGTVDEAIDTALASLDALVASASMTSGDETIRSLLDTSGIGSTQLDTFVGLWVAHEGTMDEFWAAVDGEPTLTAEAPQLRFTAEAAGLTRGFVAALSGLQAMRDATTISTVADLAMWDVADWVTFLTPIGAPDDLPGANETERIQRYAETMNRIVEETYPTQVLARRIERDTPAFTTGVFEFLDANPAFDVRTTVVPMYLEANPGSIPMGLNEGDTEANLSTVQRLWSLTPRLNRYDVTHVLLEEGIASASQIVSMGYGMFQATVATLLEGIHPVHDGAGLADVLWKNAVFKYGASVAVIAQYATPFHSAPIPAIQYQAFVLTSPGAATLEALFGSMDYCGCEHCRSMFGPAAYFVDLLSLLRMEPSITPGSSVFDVLTARRGDLDDIELSCINTNAALPYIDLVNELLEQAASAEGPPPFDFSANQTTWTTEELRLFPEHRDVTAYDGAATEIYPWALPFHLPTVELRLYLERLGVPRSEAMRALQSPSDPLTAELVAETLGMTPFEADVVRGAEPANAGEAWNLSTPGFGTTLSEDLAQLLTTSGLDLDELLQAVALPWIAQGAVVQPAYEGGLPSCNLDDISLPNFTDAVAGRLHRFLRLARRLDLSWADLDVAIRKLGGAPDGHSVWANGLVFHPNLDTLVDSESGGTGSATGTTLVPAESARDFEASAGDRIGWTSVADVSDGPFSFACWINQESLSAEQCLLEVRGTGSTLSVAVRITASSEIRFLWQRATTHLQKISVATGSLIGAWHHIAVTYDNSGSAAGINLYLDGALLTTSSDQDGSGAFDPADGEWTLGNRLSGGDGFDGIIRDTRVWARELTAAEVGHVFAGEPDLRALYDQWRVTETSVPTSGLLFAPDLATLDDPESGLSGTSSNAGYDDYHQALIFNNDAADCSWPSITNPVGAPLSFACWVRPIEFGASDLIFSIDGTASADAYHFRISNTAGRFEFLHVRDGGGTHQRRTSVETLPLRAWTHVAFIFDGTSSGTGIQLFINGTEATYSQTTDGSGGTPRVPDGDWHLGNTSQGTASFRGKIRAPRVWNRQLSAAEILSLYGADPADDPIDIDVEFLAWLADLRRVRKRLGLTWTETVALWSAIDTRTPEDGVSQYDRLFLSRAVTPAPTSPFDLNAGRTELASIPTLDPGLHYDTIRAALAVNDTVLQTLVDAVLSDTVLNIANLSQLYRHTLLAHGLGTNADELLRLIALVPGSPFASPASTLAFLDAVDELRSSSMSVDELDYLCRHAFDPATGIHPSDDEIAETVHGILDAVAALDAELVVDGDDATQVQTHLQALYAEDAVVSGEPAIQEWMRILGLETPIDGLPEATWVNAALAELGSSEDLVATLDAQVGPDAPGYPHAIPVFVAIRRSRGIDALVAQALSDATGLQPDAASTIARTAAILTVGGSTAQDVLVDEALLVSDDPGPEHIDAIVRIHKAALLVRGLGIPVSDLGWYFVVGGAPQALDLTQLPVSEAASGAAAFARWRALRLGQDLQSSFSLADNAIRLAIGEPDLASATAVLVASSNWEQADVDFVVGPELLDLSTQSDYQDPWTVARIRDAVDLVRRTGIRAADLATMAQSTPDADSASAARRALKARHGEAAWPDVIRPVTDELRELQRDALLGFLIGRGDFSTAEEVYDHLLVDPKMNACMQTSRIKLALSSVQLFIQRGLMRLEGDDVSFSAPVGELWTWMKNYRLWEANRRVFFYPENWIEPELRDDKTEIFQALEAQLNQGALDERSVERAYTEYLYRLHEVAQLDVLAVYHEVPEGGGQIVHVLGRTHGEPRKHFHRTRVDDTYWTPWAEVDVQIEGERVVLLEHNRRLFMFWLEAQQQREEVEPGGESTPEEFFQLRIGWSELRDGTWSAEKHSPIASVTVSTEHAERLFLSTYVVSFTGGVYIDVLRHDGDDDCKWQTAFRYDDCRDEVWEQPNAPIYPYSAADVGLAKAVRKVDHQQQVGGPGDVFLLRRTEASDSYLSTQVIINPYRHTLALAHQDVRYWGYTPVVFDNGAHSLYIRPVWWGDRDNIPPGLLPAQGPAGLPAGGPASGSWEAVALISDLPPSPPPVAPSGAFTALDQVAVATAWENSIPGTYAVIDGGDLLSVQANPSDAATTLALTEAIATGDVTVGGGSAPLGSSNAEVFIYRCDPFHHPYICEMRSALNRHGVPGVFGVEARDAGEPPSPLRRQLREEVHFIPYGQPADPEDTGLSSFVAPPYPVDDFDFSPGGAYSVYNWEIFFHVPLYIAERLRAEQRFAEAQRWYHYIFDPLAPAEAGVSNAARFWNIKPFYQEAIGEFPGDIVQAVFNDDGLAVSQTVADWFGASVLAWLADPFNPHAIARWRPGTYRWAVVRGYLGNLIDWADSLFRRDTIESINEATQLYLLASSILGPRPTRTPAIDPPVRTFAELGVTELFGGLTTLEGFLPAATEPGFTDSPPDPPMPPVWWYFCLPPNDQLLALWDTIADRLFKIRNCQNIDGVARQLPLFEPPIDPALLVKAKAAGLDLADVIADLQAPLPHYRYRVYSTRATELCGDVRALGSALLQALEQRDAAHLAELRATHEVGLLESMRSVRVQAIEEAKERRRAANAAIDAVEHRRTFYENLLRTPLLEQEGNQLLRFEEAKRETEKAEDNKRNAAAVQAAIRTIHAGLGDNVLVLGGEIASGIMGFKGDVHLLRASRTRDNASIQQVIAHSVERAAGWRLEKEFSEKELVRLRREALAAEIRVALALAELEAHDKQIEQAKVVEEYLQSRYTSEELYAWMIGQLSGLYFQAYKLAYELAKRAERTMQYELLTTDAFVEFGNWDSLHKGLLAGERLALDLRRMEAAYLAKDRRDYELTKRVSLRQIDPAALIDLRSTGGCEFRVHEILYDLDHPGHFRRRIKSVSVTIPATVGPHTTLGATLTLLEDHTRIEAQTGDAALRTGYGGTSAIATSTARNDAGLFQLDFRDERYLPFEGAGADSRWRLRLPGQFRQFDYETITDVELQIQYTAREGGSDFRMDVEGEIETALETATAGPLAVMFSARAAFPTAWERFLYPAVGEEGLPIEIPLVLERIPFLMRMLSPTVSSVRFVFVLEPGASGVLTSLPATDATVTPPGAAATTLTIDTVNGLAEGTATVSAAISDDPWELSVGSLVVSAPDQVKDLLVLATFGVTVP